MINIYLYTFGKYNYMKVFLCIRNVGTFRLSQLPADATTTTYLIPYLDYILLLYMLTITVLVNRDYLTK